MAMFTLTRIHNDIDTYNRQFLAPALAKPAAWLLLPPTNFETSATHRFDVGSLAFLLQTITPIIFLKLALEEDRFHGLVDTIRRRSEYHELHYPKEMATIRLSYNNPELLSADKLAKLVNRFFYLTLHNLTTDIETLVTLGIASSKEVADELREVLQAELLGEKIIGFSVAEEVARAGSPIMQARNAAADKAD